MSDVWYGLWNGQCQFCPSVDYVEVGGRWIPTEILVEIRGGPSQPNLSMKIEVRENIPQWTEVTLRARANGPEVRDKDFAALRLDDWLEVIVSAASAKGSGIPGLGGWSKPQNDESALHDIRALRKGRPRTYTPELLQKTAEVYRRHFVSRPTEAVARTFGVPHRTAARYVQRAREAGHLPPTDRGKKKA